MTRRTYIYWALPLFALLSCGPMLGSGAVGSLGVLLAASVAILVAWGVMWLRLYGLFPNSRPEFAVLGVLPHAIYYASRYFGIQAFAQSPAWQNLYALTWLGFAGVGIVSMRQGVRDGAPRLRTSQDAVFLLMIPIILLYSASTFTAYYTQLTAL